jgi:hypothetical protein
MTLGPAIILIIVAAIAGYVVGIIDSRMTTAVQKKISDDTAAKNASLTAANAEEQERVGEHVVLKVSIDKALKWRLDLDGKRLDDPNTMSAEQRQRVVNVVVQMRPWIDGKPAQVAAPQPEPVPEALPSLRSLSTINPTQTAIPITPQPRVDPMRGLRSLLKSEVKAPGEGRGVSIVTMIDEVLQAKLLGTTLLNKGIRLEEGSSGEVIVYVGFDRYSGVDAVPDPEIRAIIKAAISDWEKK